MIENIEKLKYLTSLRINSKKTHHSSKKNRINVTGLVITNNCTVSIGRNKKREIRTMIYNWDKLNTIKKNTLLDIYHIALLLNLSL